jgi:SSS family solute:Na+ symporter
MGYALVTQLAPSLFVSCAARNPLTAAGAGTGIVVGVTIVVATTLTKTTIGALAPGLPQWMLDLNIGIVALAANVAVAVAVSLAQRLAVRTAATAPG